MAFNCWSTHTLYCIKSFVRGHGLTPGAGKKKSFLYERLKIWGEIFFFKTRKMGSEEVSSFL